MSEIAEYWDRDGLDGIRLKRVLSIRLALRSIDDILGAGKRLPLDVSRSSYAFRGGGKLS